MGSSLCCGSKLELLLQTQDGKDSRLKYCNINLQQLQELSLIRCGSLNKLLKQRQEYGVNSNRGKEPGSKSMVPSPLKAYAAVASPCPLTRFRTHRQKSPASLSSAALCDDLHWFDPATKTWSRLTASNDDSRPSARFFHGFTSAGGKIYVHGGVSYDEQNQTGTLLWTQAVTH